MWTILAVGVCLVAFACEATNVDVLEPILRTTIQTTGYFDDVNKDLFGYRVALYETDNQIRIIVSAPRGSSSSPPTPEGYLGLPYGVVYTCPVDPGTCEGFGVNGNTAARDLYDTAGNEMPVGDVGEQKDGQFLGGTLKVRSGDSGILVCAPRYISRLADARLPVGRCFYSFENISTPDFFIPQLCSDAGDQATTAYCVAGVGGDIIGSSDYFSPIDSNSIQGSISIGAPGAQSYRGIVVGHSIVTPNPVRSVVTSSPDLSVRQPNSLLGYDVAIGRIYTLTTSSVQRGIESVASAPRYDQLTGAVFIFPHEQATGNTPLQKLPGEQVGSYFGFSVVVVDLNGDGFDEVVVGAPFYSERAAIEVGKIYFYFNPNVNDTYIPIVLQHTITGSVANARYGHAMSNIGDIDNNGIQDLAVSAPFGSGSGTVYIYYGVGGEYLVRLAQVIVGSELNFNFPSISEPVGFGAALSNAVDVDSNTYPDIGVGAYMTQQAIVLRSRPVANVTFEFLFNGAGTDGRAISIPDRALVPGGGCTGSSPICSVEVAICMTYNGRNVPAQLTINYDIAIERENVARGVFSRAQFSSGDRIISTGQQFDVGVATCINNTVTMRANVVDVYSPIVVDVALSLSNAAPVTPHDGNIALNTLQIGPIVRPGNANLTRIPLLNGCGSDVCSPDLEISVLENMIRFEEEGDASSTINTIVAGGVTAIGVPVLLRNMGVEPAIEPLITVSIPNELNFIKATTTAAQQLPFRCTTQSLDNEQRITCGTGIVLLEGASQNYIFLLQTRRIVGSEQMLTIQFTATSTGDDTQLNNNMASVTVPVEAIAAVSILSSFRPDSVPIAATTPPADITQPSQLGPLVRGSFIVRNDGPSTIPEVEVKILWPSINTADSYYLYPVLGILDSNDITCSQVNIDPLNLVGSGGSSRRKRQANNNEVSSSNTMILCGNNHTACVEITCTIIDLVASEAFTIIVNGYVDDRSFVGAQVEVMFETSAKVAIVNADYITRPSSDNDVTTTRLVGVPINLSSDSSGVQAWVIIVPIIVGIIVIVVATILLYFFGFFRRKRVDKGDTVDLATEWQSPTGDNPATPEHGQQQQTSSTPQNTDL